MPPMNNNSSYGSGRVPLTAVHINDGLFLNRENPKFHQTETISLVQETDTTALVHHQHDFPTDEFDHQVLLEKFLGNGVYGAAYICRFENKKYVIKLPCELISALFNDSYSNAERHTLRDVIGYYQEKLQYTRFKKAMKKIMKGGIEDLKVEAQHVEAILQPPIYRLRRVLAARQGDVLSSADDPHMFNLRDAGTPLKNLTPQEHSELIHEMHALKEHPGYTHWHPVLHADFEIPCLLSVEADGSLHDLVQIMATSFTHKNDVYFEAYSENIPAFWLTLAKQVGLAIEFMHTFGEKVHCDLKPPNILFKFNPSNSREVALHLWIADYGLCMDTGPIDKVMNKITGTPGFTPVPKEWYRNYTVDYNTQVPGIAVTMYQYMMTLLSCIIIKHIGVPKPTLLFEHIHPMDKGEIFKNHGKINVLLRNMVFENPRHQNIWGAFQGLVFHGDPKNIVPLFTEWMGSLETIEHIQFLLPIDDFQRVIKKTSQPAQSAAVAAGVSNADMLMLMQHRDETNRKRMGEEIILKAELSRKVAEEMMANAEETMLKAQETRKQAEEMMRKAEESRRNPQELIENGIFGRSSEKAKKRQKVHDRHISLGQFCCSHDPTLDETHDHDVARIGDFDPWLCGPQQSNEYAVDADNFDNSRLRSFSRKCFEYAA